MPIKLRKTNIQYDINNPESGWIILGFDENGNLVKKEENGNYEPIINDVTSGNFSRLVVDFLTVGSRVTGIDEGVYSISQGQAIEASGYTSFAQGNSVISNNDITYARGENVEALNKYSWVSGAGPSPARKIYSSGINSFVHQHYEDTVSSYGSSADYSVILGGTDNIIEGNSTRSVILGGTTNKVNNGVVNSVILGGDTQTATLSNTVYIPKIVLTETVASTTGIPGSIYYDGTNFYGVGSGGAVRLDISSVSFGGATGNIFFSNGSGGITQSDDLNFDATSKTLTVADNIQTDNITVDVLTATSSVISNSIFKSSDNSVILATDSTGTINIRPGGESVTSNASTFSTTEAIIGTTLTIGGITNGINSNFIQFLNNSEYILRLWGDDDSGFYQDNADVFTIRKNTNEGFQFNINTGTLMAVGDIVGYATTISDKRLKEDINPLENALEKVLKLNGVDYQWIDKKDGIHTGYIAQEVEKIIPNVVVENNLIGKGDELYKTIRYQEIIPYITEAIKIEDSKIKTLENKIKDLEEKIMILESKVA